MKENKTPPNMPLTATMLAQSCLSKALPLLRLAARRWLPLKENTKSFQVTNIARNLLN